MLLSADDVMQLVWWRLLADVLDARLEKTLEMCLAKFLEHFDVKQLDVVAVATVVTTFVAVVANEPVVCVLPLADVPDTSESTELVDEY